MAKCSVCNAAIDNPTPAILVMGAYGNPRCMCDECERDFETATLGKDIDGISAAMERIGNKISENDPDKQIYNTVNSILLGAAERAKKIRDGSYDFSEDEERESVEGELDDIPEELRETEEDRELDRQDEEKLKKFDEFFNYVVWGAVIGVVGFFIWKLIDTFLLK